MRKRSAHDAFLPPHCPTLADDAEREKKVCASLPVDYDNCNLSAAVRPRGAPCQIPRLRLWAITHGAISTFTQSSTPLDLRPAHRRHHFGGFWWEVLRSTPCPSRCVTQRTSSTSRQRLDHIARRIVPLTPIKRCTIDRKA